MIELTSFYGGFSMDNSNQVPSAMPGRGFLIVSVRTGGGAIPLEGALVTLRGDESIEGDAIASFITDNLMISILSAFFVIVVLLSGHRPDSG